MTQEGIVLLAIGLLVVGVAALAFVWSLYHDYLEKEKRLYREPSFVPAGFWMSRLPQQDYLRLDRIYLLGRRIAQLEFLVRPQWTAVLRVAFEGQDLRLEEWEMPDFDQLSVRMVAGVRTELRQEQNGAALVRWQRNGFDFALYLPRTEMGLAGGLLERFVTDTQASPLE